MNFSREECKSILESIKAEAIEAMERGEKRLNFSLEPETTELMCADLMECVAKKRFVLDKNYQGTWCYEGTYDDERFLQSLCNAIFALGQSGKYEGVMVTVEEER